MIENLEFGHKTNNLQKVLHDDLKVIKEDPHVLIGADKTDNFYKMTAESYTKLLKDNITTTYKKTDTDLAYKTNREVLNIATTLDLADRIETYKQGEAFCKIKDHKLDFKRKNSARLINPSMSNIGRISNQLHDPIVKELAVRTKINLWKNTNEVLQWFTKLQDKESLTFLKFDVQSMYPSITESLLDKSLDFTKEHIFISDLDVEVIKHSRKSFLFSNGDAWIKKR